MADSFTAKLNLTKPEVGASTDSWGSKLNTDLDTIDGLFDTGPYLKISAGGTGAGTAANARTSLGLGDLATKSAVTSADITNGTIVYADLQNISATSRVLGRKTSGAGTTEELTLSDVLDFVGSAAQGDILYRDSSSWARLGAGTSGQYLKTNGTGANPSWATATAPTTYLLFNSAIPSGTSYTVNSTTITGTYSRIEILLSSISHDAGSNRSLQLQISGDNGSNYCTAFTVTDSVNSGANWQGSVIIHKANETSNTSRLVQVGVSNGGASNFYGKMVDTSSISGAINNIKLTLSGSGNIDGGSVTVIGYA